MTSDLFGAASDSSGAGYQPLAARLRPTTLEDYAGIAHLTHAVRELRDEASRRVPRLRDRTVWMQWAPSRGARTEARPPWKRPMGVRSASTIQASRSGRRRSRVMARCYPPAAATAEGN